METIGSKESSAIYDHATYTQLSMCLCCLQWAPTLNGYLQFLAESEVVYNAFESIMQEASHPECECPASSRQQAAAYQASQEQLEQLALTAAAAEDT
jgi:hypothetical protein